MVFEFFYNNYEFFGFILVLTLFLVWKKKNLEITGSFPFLYMLLYKTKLGLDKMKSWSHNKPKLFLYLAYLSIFIGILGMLASFCFMFWQLHYIIDHQLDAGGGIVLPLKTESGINGSVPIFYVPFWYWLLALFVLVIVHEFAHGVIAQRFDIDVKSSGFAFLGILLPIMPAAFVEPDEKQLKKKPWWQQIAVFGAGSLSNFLFGFLFLAIALFVANPIIDNTMMIGNVGFSDITNESDLMDYNITSGQILGINGIYDNELIWDKIQNLSPQENIELIINSSGIVGTYNIKAYENQNREGKGMIGITPTPRQLEPKPEYEKYGNLPLYFGKLLTYFWFLNIGIGIMNLLPIWITDGGQILRTLLLQKFKKKIAMRVYNIVSYISLILIIFTVWPGMLNTILGLL